MTRTVRTSRHRLNPLRTADTTLLLSSCLIRWATVASAVGEAKLALTAMLTCEASRLKCWGEVGRAREEAQERRRPRTAN
jgi:hypothetical protein